MSTKVLVIPEDPKNNGYILKPIVEAVMAEADRPNANVIVLPRSRLTGITNAKDAIRNELASAWRWMDVWIFVPDADRTNADALTAITADLARQGITLICCAANPEVEAWMLAGHRQKLKIPWDQAAGHLRFKEDVFDPFMEQHGFPDLPGLGREKLTRETLANFPLLKKLCPEIGELEDKLRRHFSRV